MGPEENLPRSVKPRKANPAKFLPIIAIDTVGGSFLVERSGEVGSIEEAIHLFASEPPSIVIIQSPAEFLLGMDEAFESNPAWQFRISPIRREVNTPTARRNAVVVDTMVNYFGWKVPNSKKAGRWFYPVDPYLFTRASFTEVLTGDGPRVERLLSWGKSVREFAQAQNLRVTPTGGGLSAQLLRDPRFYPEARRKVPYKTNRQLRDELPGNFYRLYAEEEEVHQRATYLDMTSAHHNVALTLKAPNANGLYRRGDWSTDPTDATAPRWTPGSRAFASLTDGSFMGALRVKLNSPKLPAGSLTIPALEIPGTRVVTLYTNELHHVRQMGGTILGVHAAWGSYQEDTGLSAYAAWALTELATAGPDRRSWLKPTLLSAYGILAATPKAQEMGHKRAQGGTVKRYPAGRGMLTAVAHELGLRETPVANVLHRAMIESGTRMAAVSMAQDMRALGHRVIAIYADAVFIVPAGPVPLLAAPWAVKGELTRLIFHNATSFTSLELCKLPGIPKEGMDRAHRLRVAEIRRSMLRSGGRTQP